jgi:arsenite methyltransferase
MTKLNQFLIYDELPLWSAPFGLMLLDTVRLRKNMNILDIGSGSGFPMLEIAERAGNSCEITGIDPSPDAVHMIRKKIELKKISNAGIIKSTAENLPFPDKHFHLVVANNGLNNVSDEKQVLSECFRVCKKGAQVVLTMNLPHTMTEFYDILGGIFLENENFIAVEQMQAHIHEKRKPAEFWKERILHSGFSIQDMIVDGFKIKFTDGTSFLSHFFIRTAFLPSWKKFTSEKELGTAERKMNRIAKEEGSFSVSIPFICFDLIKQS